MDKKLSAESSVLKSDNAETMQNCRQTSHNRIADKTTQSDHDLDLMQFYESLSWYIVYRVFIP